MSLVIKILVLYKLEFACGYISTTYDHLHEVQGFQGTKNYDWSSGLCHHVILSSNYVILQSKHYNPNLQPI